MADVKDVSPAPDDALNEVIAPRDAFRIALPNFEGPLDLLLHLIREHKLDILDIPIALITEKYLAHLELMREINLDIAGEFLVMASTLLHLKSRMLLPRDEAALADGADASQEQLDPRAELVRRLLEYQKYKAAADQLLQADILDRMVFTRKVRQEQVPLDPDEIGLQELSIYKLIEALDRVLKALEPQKQHEVMRERLSLTQAMYNIAAKVRGAEAGRVSFFALFEGQRVRSQVVITFLALLEMCKHRLLRVFQADDGDDILISGRPEALSHFGTEDTHTAEDIEGEYQ
ncbi:MAG: segregation/condensation protein A [Myxococcales bacterium]|nr:segregation/condensation protein A [Myxococcales bacterium]